MAVFDLLDGGGHEQVVWGRDATSGLRAIVAVHSTALGPALGGVRWRTYAAEDAALVDVLRLSRGMTYKAAAAGLDLGGGKAVILAPPPGTARMPVLRAYGRLVESLSGRYITAEDVGTGEADMDAIRTQTRHVTGVRESLGGSGDPSPATALGVFHAMGAVAQACWGTPSLGGRHVVVVGVGKVGSALVGHLVGAGATVSVADIDDVAVRSVVARHGATAVDVDDALVRPCDVLAPCALGGVLDAGTIARLGAAAVCGSANNQLAEVGDAERLADAGVLYAPDYVVSAGGIINIAEELRPGGYDPDRARRAVAAVGRTTARVLGDARAAGCTPLAAADRLAESRLDAARP
ncbi:MAG TPA: Glu/Leu/Phe/Val dehydrogenase dimerization domain-containing protein [Acidimicrobiales bacterium]|nr:Glu/Leu/Phe/Val dehydrogenase dimerization domain-containing protein [Acidimicrobiales bacterium]